MELTATAIGFYKNRRIRVGESFEFDGDKPPKWAAPKADALKQIAQDSRRDSMSADTKPVEAQKATRRKASGE